MALKLVFNVEGVNDSTIYNFVDWFYKKGFTLNPKAKGLKLKDTKIIIVDLQEKIISPLSLFVDKMSSSYIFFILKED